ncbi:MAG: DUF3164 family protein [Treponema sp.]|nr:DUF3164 family protein [Treponema sp.]
MINTQGRQVPVELVSDIDKLRDQTVRKIAGEVLQMKQTMTAFKKRVQDDIFTFLALSAEKYDKPFGGKKGNISLTSYDGRYKILVAVSASITFNERLQVAREIISDCLDKWSANARPEIRILVNDAFQVDKTGNISTTRVLGLRRLEISDPDWQKAMQAISDSIEISGSKQYLRFYEREEQGEYKQIPLDISAL